MIRLKCCLLCYLGARGEVKLGSEQLTNLEMELKPVIDTLLKQVNNGNIYVPRGTYLNRSQIMKFEVAIRIQYRCFEFCLSVPYEYSAPYFDIMLPSLCICIDIPYCTDNDND